MTEPPWKPIRLNPQLATLLLGYILGYLANMIPIPGGVGVLKGGLVGALVLDGAPPTQAIAGVLIYYAIASWIPSLGGVWAYSRIRGQIEDLAPQTYSGR